MDDMTIQMLVLCAVLAVISVFVIANWAARDARQRGESAFLVFLLVLALFPLGLIAWFLYRPPLPLHSQR